MERVDPRPGGARSGAGLGDETRGPDVRLHRSPTHRVAVGGPFPRDLPARRGGVTLGFNAMQPGEAQARRSELFLVGVVVIVARSVGRLVGGPGDPRGARLLLLPPGTAFGSSHTVEIWFALRGDVVYLRRRCGTEESDWVKNLRADPTCGLRPGDRDLICPADARGRSGGGRPGPAIAPGQVRPRDADDLSEWARTARPVAIDLPPE